MKSLIIYLGKKYIVASINDVLDRYKGNVSEVAKDITVWIKRLQIIVEELQNILDRISDGKIEDDEILKSKQEVESIIKNWK